MMRAWSQSQSEPLPGSGRVRKEPPSIAEYNDSPPPNGVRSTVLLDLSPLRKHRDFRCVFVGQLISAFGSFLTYVALTDAGYCSAPRHCFFVDRSRLPRTPCRRTRVWPSLFIVTACMSAVKGFHTPSLESLTPRLVDASVLHDRSS